MGITEPDRIGAAITAGITAAADFMAAGIMAAGIMVVMRRMG
jgi:hypothetical protein